ncbi:MAG: hypothetical protein WC091_02140 [Sulfuricellaceae bacterium]
MKRYVTLLLFLFLSFIPSLSRAGLDMQGIKDALGYAQNDVRSVGSLVIAFVSALVSITIIIRLLYKAKPVKTGNVAAFT